MKRTLVILGAVSLSLAGCYTTRGLGISELPTTESSAAPVAASQSAPPTNPSGPRPLGSASNVTGQGSDIDITVFTFVQNIAPDAPMPPTGGHWAGADVQSCPQHAATPFTTAASDWSAFDANGNQYTATRDEYSALPTPAYPINSQSVATGQCVRGWVLFPVPYAVAVATVKYKASSDSPTIWSVTK